MPADIVRGQKGGHMEYKHQYRAHLASRNGLPNIRVKFWAQNIPHAVALLAERYPGYYPIELKRVQ